MLRKMLALSTGIIVPLLSLAPPAIQGALAFSENEVPKVASIGTDRGPIAPDLEQNLTVVLKLPDRATFDKTVESLYDPASPNYHHWLSDTELAKFAPTPSDFATVKGELVAQGFSVLSSDPNRFSLRVRGSVATIQNAFQTELHTFEYRGRTYQAHTAHAQLAGEAAHLIDSVAGLDRHQVLPRRTIALDPVTGQPKFKRKVISSASVSSILNEITDVALSSATDFNYTTPGALLPVANYWGSVYDSDSNLTVSFTPAQLQAHYGLAPLYAKGYDGAGQTIALIEAYGYASAEKDANVAAKLFKLPALTASNFSVVYPEGKPLNPNAADLTGWTIEIAIDIQSSHAIAPGAKIVVVASSGQDNEDQIASLQYVISHKLARTASSSWENDSEIIAGADEENAFNSILELGAAAGISFQFSSGDDGDGGLGTPVGAVGVPSNSPYATAVGGTSILNNPYGSGQVVTGWGNYIVTLNEDGPTDPPTETSFFNGGAGGGESVFFKKPSWQSALPGKGREVPDVSALADPYTGFVIVFTEEGVQYAQAGWGGTSLSSPIFTAIWAIADQYNGAPLGQAAPAISKLKSGQIRDVRPTSALTDYDVSGTVHDSSGTTFYSVTGLFAGLLYSTKEFTSAIWNPESGLGVAISFGTDSSLTVTKGWDNVTGFGEPNGLPFIQGVTGKSTGAPVTSQ
jgi:subtilase family serine protease